VELEGAQAREQRMARAVEVRRAGAQQAAVCGGVVKQSRLRLVVGDVEDLDPVQPQGAIALERVDHRLRVGDVPERVRPDRDASSGVDHVDGLGRGRLGAAGETRLSLDQVAADQVADRGDPLIGETDAVGGVTEDRFCEVRATDRQTRGPALLDRCAVELESRGPHAVDHPIRAPGAIGAKAVERVEQRDVVVVDPVPEHVDVSCRLVDDAQLDRGHQLQLPLDRGRERLVDSLHRVVVGQREQPDARVGGGGDHVPRREVPVGVRGVRLKVEIKVHRAKRKGNAGGPAHTGDSHMISRVPHKSRVPRRLLFGRWSRYAAAEEASEPAKPVRSPGSAGIRSAIPWVAADQAVFSATSLALAIGVARHATPAQFGAFGIAYVVYTIVLGTVEAFTAEVITVRGDNLPPTGRRRMMADASGTAVCAGLVCTLVGVLLAVFGHGGAAIAVAILLPAPLLFLQDVWRFAFFASRRPRAALVNDLIWAALLAVGLVIAPSFGTDEATSLVWLWSGAGALCGVIGAVQARCLPRVGASMRWTRAHGRAGGRYAGEFLALYGGAQAVLVAVGIFAGLADSGGYRGAQLLFGPVQVAVNAARIAVMPLLTRARVGVPADAVWRRLQIAGATATVVTLAWGAAVLALPSGIGYTLLGPSWSATYPILPAMLCATAANAFGLGPLLLLRSAEALQSTFKARVIGAVATFAFGATGAWIDGALAASIGVALGAMLTTAALWFQARLVTLALMAPCASKNPKRVRRRGLPLREAVLGDRPRPVAEFAFETQAAAEPDRISSAEPTPVPDIFVIGAMRAGTTTFCADLGTHRDIVVPHVKEPWILVRSRGRMDVAQTMYRSLYGGDTREAARLLDGSTSYSMLPEQPPVAALAARLSPMARILYLVRDPVYRAISHYRHQVAWGVTEHADFETAVRSDRTLIDYGRYWYQLQPWLAAFGSDAVSVIPFEEYTASRRRVVGDVVASLGLDPALLAIDESAILNRSADARTVPSPWRRLLLSDVYQFRARHRIPETWRRRVSDRFLPRAWEPSVAPSRDSVEWIIQESREDADALAAFLGRSEPLWDWNATVRRFS